MTFNDLLATLRSAIRIAVLNDIVTRHFPAGGRRKKLFTDLPDAHKSEAAQFYMGAAMRTATALIHDLERRGPVPEDAMEQVICAAAGGAEDALRENGSDIHIVPVNLGRIMREQEERQNG
jgi:hypothetical protein